ncbi:hypothetical protein M436DRAFT_58816 [Aureobasidium namibiae CBS 147.97]|uniref:Uncharacterized protein n=1 Tax=Aureobasidium namibiae CBS 147.97 TaxID=1043004 RepID=A0A074X0Z3_9PEZI
MSESFNSDANQPSLTQEQCAWWITHGAQPRANSEISGIGVVVAFVLSAYITTGLAIAAYLLGAIDNKVLGPVDLLVHRIPTRSKISPAWREAIQQCILLFSDQQIMTGIAILVAGFLGLSGVMDVYHFQIVIMLGWMSSSVNLTALIVLGRYFEEHKAVFMWRLAGMLVLLILLLVALVPTASIRWAMWHTEDGDPEETSGWAIPAGCFFIREWGHGFSPDAPFSYVLLIVSYVWKIGSVSKTTRSLFLQWIREPIEGYLGSLLLREAQARDPSVAQGMTWRHRLYLVLYIDLLVLFEFAASFAASLWLSAIGLLYATTEIVIPRHQNAKHFAEEDEWTFGQIVPIILLLQPIGAVLELYRGGHRTKATPDPSLPVDDLELSVPEDPVDHQLSIEPTIEPRQGNLEKAEAQTVVVVSHASQAEESDWLTRQRMTILSSRTFAALIILTHVCLLTFSILAFYINALSIGFEVTHDWIWMLMGTAVYIGILITITIISICFDNVSR